MGRLREWLDRDDDEDRVDGQELPEPTEPGSDERLRDKLREYLDEHKIEDDERRPAEKFLEELEDTLG